MRGGLDCVVIGLDCVVTRVGEAEERKGKERFEATHCHIHEDWKKRVSARVVAHRRRVKQ